MITQTARRRLARTATTAAASSLFVHHTNGSAQFDLDVAIRRARWKSGLTGERHRVEICRHAPEEHFLGGVWADTHFIVKPVDQPPAMTP